MCGGWAGLAAGGAGVCTQDLRRAGHRGLPSLFLPSHACSDAPLHMGPSGQIWVAELKPIIRFTPASSQPVLSGELFRLLPSFSCRLRFVADEQGVFLKAAGCPGRPPFHLGGPASWAGTRLPVVEYFFLHKNWRENVFGSPCLP